MKLKLAVAVTFAVLLLASAVRADTVNVNGLPMIIPDGSTVTSVTTGETPSGDVDYEVDYSFADGTGFTAVNLSQEIVGGEIFFTNPVSDAEFSYYGGPFDASDNLGDTFFGSFDEGAGGTVTFAGPGITSLGWQDGDAFVNGITSLSYTVPEPSSLLLSGMGLAALIGLARRDRTKRPNTTAQVLIYLEADAAK
jgi:hypothetical protein